MKTTIKIASLALLLAASAPAVANAQDDLEPALQKMASATGDDYVAARDAVTSREGASAQLDAYLAGKTWTDETFKVLAMATIARSYVANPDMVTKVNHLEGLDAANYLKYRRPDPECCRELRTYGAEAVGPLLEVYLKTFDRYPFAHRIDDMEKAAVQNAKEKTALRVGLVVTLSRSKHPAGFFVCREVARDAAEEEGVRSQAIEGLGDVGTRAAQAELVRLYGDATLPAGLKLAAIRGMGSVPSSAALEFLTARLASEDAAERKTAVVSLGMLGSAWAWDARGEEIARTRGDQIRRGVASALVGAIDKLGAECGDELVDALATVAHPSSLELLSGKDGAVAKNALERVKAAVERNKR